MIQILFNPKVAAFVASLLVGRPDIADDLIRICERESRCHAVGPHKRDRWISPHEWHGQVRLGHLDRSCQPKRARGGWATRGAFGLSAGAHWEYLWPCYHPAVFDVPLVSAIIAARKYIRRCLPLGRGKRRRRLGWCGRRRR